MPAAARPGVWLCRRQRQRAAPQNNGPIRRSQCPHAHGVAILQALAPAQNDMGDLGASRALPVGRISVGLPPSVGRQLTMALIDGFARALPDLKGPPAPESNPLAATAEETPDDH